MGQNGQRLAFEEHHKVQYAIPFWLRDEQIKVAIGKVKERIKPYNEDPKINRGPDERVAIACFGPSLNDTWEEIRGYRWIISCSGAHKFLIERGIIPTWHVEVDPRAHKVQLLGPPHRDVEYLISSTCHPDYFDHLAGFNVKLWHVFDSQEEAARTLPRGEWALTGGASVGLRALTIARFLGFVNLQVFGMDGCEGPTGKHAAAHPNQPPGYSETEYKGKFYRTTTGMLECAKQTWHELNQMPDVVASFHGDGLVQDMAKDYKREAPVMPILGITRPELISAEYRHLNERLHSDNLAYGVGGGKHAATVLKLAESLKTTSILDYGCGKGYLAKAIPFPIWEYDPAIPGKDELPRAADLVVCTDVLEHIEPDKLMFVLDDLRRCIKRLGYFVIDTEPSTKKLADGRNTHLILKKPGWWLKKLSKFFKVGKVPGGAGRLLHVCVAPAIAIKIKSKNEAAAT